MKEQRSTSAPGIRLGALLVLVWLGGASLPAQTLLLDETVDLTGWQTTGDVRVLTTTDAFDINGKPFSLTPAPGRVMFRIEPDTSLSGPDDLSAGFGDLAMGLAPGTLSALLENSTDSITNFGFATTTLSLATGTYSFSWAMAANDYFPYNDGVLFALVGAGSQQVISLARNGSSETDTYGPDEGTLILGSYGSTAWKTTTFSVSATDDYQITFAAYNWSDTGVNPVFYVSAEPGSFSGVEVSFSGGTPIPEPSTYALCAGLLGLVAAAGWHRHRARWN